MVRNKVSLDVVADTSGAVTKIKGVDTAFKNLETSVKTDTTKIGQHFDGVGDRIARRFQRKDIKTLGSSISNSFMALATGGSLADVGAMAGITMAVSMATQLTVHFAEKLAGSAAVQALLAALAPIGAALVSAAGTIGTTIGTVIPTLAAVAMAIWPALLVAAIVAGIIFLINNPQIVGNILRFASDVLANLGKGLARLGEFLGKIFGDAFAWVHRIVLSVVRPIIDVIMGIIDAVRDALKWIGILNKTPMKKGGSGPLNELAGHAEGGWVGLHGPEIGLLGERGPEYVRKAGTGTGDERGGSGGLGGGPIYLVLPDGRVLAEVVDAQLYRKGRMNPVRIG